MLKSNLRYAAVCFIGLQSRCNAFTTQSIVHSASFTSTSRYVPVLKNEDQSTSLPSLRSERPIQNQKIRNRRVTSLNLNANAGIDIISSLSQTIFTTTSTVPLLTSFGINASLFVILKSKLEKLLTPEGFYHSLALGTMLWNTVGWQGWTTCVLYLFLGSLVTKVKFQEKEAMGIAEGRGGRRGPENVWGSAATGLACTAASVYLHPVVGSGASSLLGFVTYDLLILAYVSSLATKLADTFASEIGKAYGKTTFLITTMERVKPGTEGAVSLEGTIAAAVGGCFLPIYASAIGFMNGGMVSIGIATLAAFLATNAESLIGATLQGKKGFEWMTNEVVNFFNTVIGASIAIGVGSFLL